MKLKDKIKNYIRSFLKYMALSPAGIVLLTWSNNTEADLRGYNIYYSTTLVIIRLRMMSVMLLSIVLITLKTGRHIIL